MQTARGQVRRLPADRRDRAERVPGEYSIHNTRKRELVLATPALLILCQILAKYKMWLDWDTLGLDVQQVTQQIDN